jgi:hypothetical protein
MFFVCLKKMCTLLLMDGMLCMSVWNALYVCQVHLVQNVLQACCCMVSIFMEYLLPSFQLQSMCVLEAEMSLWMPQRKNNL